MTDDGPHADARIETAGVPVEDASVAVVMTHGRGAMARGMLQFAEEFDREDVAYLAPQADRRTWYPNPFTSELASNEPHLSSALATVERVIQHAADAGVPRERTVLLGFSQGACLASEFVARNATRYGGLLAFSGGLIGPEGTPRDYGGDLEGTPVYLGCSDSDPHIPIERIHETDRVLSDLGGDVTTQEFPDAGHGVFPDEIEAARELIDGVGVDD